MNEHGEMGYSPEAMLQNSLSRYNSDIIRLCQQFPPAAIEDSEQVSGLKIVTYETPKYTVELPDGSPRIISYASYPNGMDLFPTLRTTTIIADHAEGLGKWMTNYHLHQLDNGMIATEKESWFMIDRAVLETLRQNHVSPSVTAEIDNINQHLETLTSLNPEEKEAAVAEMREIISIPNFESLTKEEISLLQDHINQLR